MLSLWKKGKFLAEWPRTYRKRDHFGSKEGNEYESGRQCYKLGEKGKALKGNCRLKRERTSFKRSVQLWEMDEERFDLLEPS